MLAALLTREYPPDVYGGAGVHVEYLARELARLIDVEVHCFGAERPDQPGGPKVIAHPAWDRLAGGDPPIAALRAMSVDLAMAADAHRADVVHSHTWYANFAGHLAHVLYDVPHVVTVHSLEPLRPWKAEQLGGGYQLSTFCERTALEAADAVIAVSSAVAADIGACYPAVDPARIHVVHNAVDTNDYRADGSTAVLDHHGIDVDRPIVVFVGRVTRQKGIHHLLAAAEHMADEVQIVLRAGAPDTPALGREVAAAIADARAAGRDIVWIEESLERSDLAALLSAAHVFCCPSVYEPFGLVNLEAMACGVPVVATAVGGIPEVVDDGVTGVLVPLTDDAELARALADAITSLLDDPIRARKMGEAGRSRVEERFSWPVVARETLDLYNTVVR